MTAPSVFKMKRSLNYIIAQLEVISHSDSIDLHQIGVIHENILASDHQEEWPICELLPLLNHYLQHGSDEKADTVLVSEIRRIFGNLGRPVDVHFDESKKIIFNKKFFCFTGLFEFGSRDDCAEAVKSAGGKFTNTLRQDLDYLVVGRYCSPDWKYTRFGIKLKTASERNLVERRKILIVSEHFWLSELRRTIKSIA